MQQKNSLRTSSCSMSWPVVTRTTSMLWKLIASLKIGCRTWPCPDITLNCKGSVSPEQRLFGEWSDKNKPWMYNSTWMQIGRWWLGNQKKHFHQTKSNIECTSTCMCFPRICDWSNQKTRSNSHLMSLDCLHWLHHLLVYSIFTWCPTGTGAAWIEGCTAHHPFGFLTGFGIWFSCFQPLGIPDISHCW